MKSSIKTIIFINFFVYLLWHFISFHFMSENFLVSSSLLFEGKIWTLITSTFSHNLFFHFLLNMLILFNFGSILEEILGIKNFLKLYLISGILGSIFHCFTSSYFLNQPSLFALGASGAISGLVLFYSLLFPKNLVYFFGIIPVPSILASLIFISFDLYGLIQQSHGHGLPIGHGAHLGGAAYGIIYFLLRRKKLISISD